MTTFLSELESERRGELKPMTNATPGAKMASVQYSVGSVPSRGGGMRFVLVYKGPLHSKGDLKDIHAIRKQFHPQLQQQWEVNPALAALAGTKPEISPTIIPGFDPPSPVKMTHGSFCFAPMVVKRFHLVCSLDITFLRPEDTGDLVRHGGDIDNRIKTLFDSLRVPSESEVAKLSPDADENPFYCLLEDDRLIAGFQVKAERLLVPDTASRKGYVELMIGVVVWPTRITYENICFLGGV
jgi:hypothetical protein